MLFKNVISLFSLFVKNSTMYWLKTMELIPKQLFSWPKNAELTSFSIQNFRVCHTSRLKKSSNYSLAIYICHCISRANSELKSWIGLVVFTLSIHFYFPRFFLGTKNKDAKMCNWLLWPLDGDLMMARWNADSVSEEKPENW